MEYTNSKTQSSVPTIGFLPQLQVQWFVLHFEGMCQRTLDPWAPEDIIYMVVLPSGAHVLCLVNMVPSVWEVSRTF